MDTKLRDRIETLMLDGELAVECIMSECRGSASKIVAEIDEMVAEGLMTKREHKLKKSGVPTGKTVPVVKFVNLPYQYASLSQDDREMISWLEDVLAAKAKNPRLTPEKFIKDRRFECGNVSQMKRAIKAAFDELQRRPLRLIQKGSKFVLRSI